MIIINSWVMILKWSAWTLIIVFNKYWTFLVWRQMIINGHFQVQVVFTTAKRSHTHTQTRTYTEENKKELKKKKFYRELCCELDWDTKRQDIRTLCGCIKRLVTNTSGFITYFILSWFIYFLIFCFVSLFGSNTYIILCVLCWWWVFFVRVDF